MEEGKTLTCTVCGNGFAGRASRRYCSTECKSRRQRDYQRENQETIKNYHRGYMREWKRTKNGVSMVGNCAECGQQFEKPHGRSKFCSEGCRVTGSTKRDEATRALRKQVGPG